MREAGELKTYRVSERIRLNYIKKSPSKMRKTQRQLFLSPTGFNTKKDELYYRNTMFLHNEIGVGLIDNISISSGALGILPYLGARASFSPHRLLHLSAGGIWLFLGGDSNFAWHLAASLGTKSYFLNIARIKYHGSLYSEPNDFQATSLGGSFQLNKKLNFFAEFILLDQKPFGYLDTIEGRLNIFSGGIKWHGRTTAVCVGVFSLGPRPNFCTGCQDQITRPYPGFSATILFD